MKQITRTFFAAALAIALLAIPYAHAGGSPGGLPTPGAGSMKTPNDTGYRSPDVTGTDARAARSNPATEGSDRGKTNRLNQGTRGGANSDVNSGTSGSRQNGQ